MIRIDQDSFSTHGRAVPWSTIRAVSTFKRDLWAHDEICVAFEISVGSWVIVAETETGFEELTKEIERRFPVIPPDWFREVALPAFQENYRKLWQR